jgi:hypothetical protein
MYTVPAKVNCFGVKGVEMVGRSTQALTELTCQGTCDNITSMTFMILIPVQDSLIDKVWNQAAHHDIQQVPEHE